MKTIVFLFSAALILLQPVSASPLTSFGRSVPTQADVPLLGFADLHSHQFANLAFGGNAVVGQAYGPISLALSPSEDLNKHGIIHTRNFLGTVLAERTPFNTGYIYSNLGFPSFVGWPRSSEVTHQKVYQDWLFRAVQGGLRLMVVHAVDSLMLCRLTANDGRNCKDEMYSINLQLDAAYQMQAYIDATSGGSGQGWYRIVTTPAEARRVIQEGKLAVVLAIETAHLFNCSVLYCEDQPNIVGTRAWDTEFRDLWSRGVRHYFVVHQDDNAFGSPSYFQTFLQSDRGGVHEFVNPRYMLFLRDCPAYDFEGGRCNARGLFPTGVEFVQQLMRFGAIIDVDHMSDMMFSDTLTLTHSFRYPVVASHAGFNEINRNAQDHEGQLTSDELNLIVQDGGMIGLITNQGNLDEVGVFTRPDGTRILHACGQTSETFAQALLYAYYHLPAGNSIGIGTDFNGPITQPGPRHGSARCPGGTPNIIDPQVPPPLEYPFLARGAMTQLGQYTTGLRTYDFNQDGLAHVGLLPDFLADLETIGVTPQEIDRLFRSAEGYIRMWERAEAASWTMRLNTEGTLLRDPSGAVHIVYGGADFYIPDPQVFNSLGLNPQDIIPVPEGTFTNIPDIPRDGTLLREHSGAIYVIYGGAKFHIPNPVIVDRLGFNANLIGELWNGAMNQIPTIPRDGTLIRETNNEVYFIFGGAKFRIPTQDVMEQFDPGGAATLQAWNGALDHISSIPRDGTLVRVIGAENIVYIVYGGAILQIPTQSALELYVADPSLLPLIWDGAMDHLPGIPQDGTLLRENSGAVYVIIGGAKFHIPDTTAWEQFDPGFSQTLQVWDGALNYLPLIPRDGTLLRELSSSETWLIQNQMLYRVTEGRIDQLGLNRNNIRIVPDGSLTQIPYGGTA